MNATLSVIIGASGGILTGLAALLTAITAWRRGRKVKKTEDEATELTLDAVEKLFANQATINDLFLHRLQAIEDKIKELTK